MLQILEVWHFFSRGFTYYKMCNLDSRIANPDQLLTTDVDKFCDSFVNLYSNVTKPFLDIGIYVFKLAPTIGAQVRAACAFISMWQFIGNQCFTGTRNVTLAVAADDIDVSGISWRFLDQHTQAHRANDSERTTIGRGVSSHQLPIDHELGRDCLLSWEQQGKIDDVDQFPQARECIQIYWVSRNFCFIHKSDLTVAFVRNELLVDHEIAGDVRFVNILTAKRH